MYTPTYQGGDSNLVQEFLRISQAFEEEKIVSNRRMLEVAGSSSVVISTRLQLGNYPLYLAVVSTMSNSGTNFTAYLLQAPGDVGTPTLVSFANIGTDIQLNIDGSGNLEVVNNNIGTRTLGVNLIRLL